MAVNETTSSKLVAHASRREFLRTCFRYPALAILGGTGVVLIARKPGFSNEVQCTVSQVCQTCRLFGDCDKPQALKTKKAS
jgi:hypothetical protein